MERRVAGVDDPGRLNWGCWSIGIAGALCKSSATLTAEALSCHQRERAGGLKSGRRQGMRPALVSDNIGEIGMLSRSACAAMRLLSRIAAGCSVEFGFCRASTRHDPLLSV